MGRSIESARLRSIAVLALSMLAGACGQFQPEQPAASEAVVYGADRILFRPASLPTLAAAGGPGRRIASLLNAPAAMSYGDSLWNDQDVPEGRVWVLVDLKGQTMSVFRGQHEVGTAVILYGVDDKLTPTGGFKVLEKRKDHHSSLYDAAMPYTLRLTNDGIAIHGSDVREGAATHGCIGVPREFGQRVFAEVKVGDEVLILEDAGRAKAPPPGPGRPSEGSSG